MTATTSNNMAYVVGKLKPDAKDQPKADAKKISEAVARISKYIKNG